MFALYHFFFNSLPPSPSYLILFSLLPFLSILFDSYPFSTQLLYIPTSLSLLVLIPISTASLLPSNVLHLFLHLPVLSILFASYPFFHSLSLMPSCSDFHYFLSCHLSLSFSHFQQPNSIYSHFKLHLIDAIHTYPCICLSDNYQTEKFLPQFTQSFSCRTLSSCTSNLH